MIKSLVIVMLASSMAFAQDTTSTTPAATTTSAESTSPVAAVTSTTTMNAPKSQLQLSLGSENYIYENDQRTFKGNGSAISSNWVGALYNMNAKTTLELRQYFQYASNKENLNGRNKQLHENDFAMAEVMLKAAYKSDVTLLGSKAIATQLRYYAPTDRVAQDNKELGRFRSDTTVEWAMTPNWTAATWFSPRVALNSAQNPNTEIGSDARYYEIKLAPSLTYAANDIYSGYVAYTIDQVYSNAQRGNWEPDQADVGTPELGAWINLGPVSINPSLTSDTNLANGDGSVFSSGSRVFSYETLGYNLNLYATF